MSFFAYYMGPPQVSFFAYYMGPPQVSFFAYCMGAPSGQFLCILYRGPPQISFFAHYRGAPQFSFFTYYMGAPIRLISQLTKCGALSSVSSLNFFNIFFLNFYALSYPWGGPHIFEFPGGGKCPLLPPPAGAHGYRSGCSHISCIICYITVMQWSAVVVTICLQYIPQFSECLAQ